MSFPSSPTTGQTAIVNNITYSYSTSTQAWTRVAGQVTATTYLTIVNNTPTNSTITGALQVIGGVGIGGGLYVGGTITATSFAGTFIGNGAISTATNLLGGTAGQLPYQTAPGATGFAGPGTAGQVLVSAGTSAPVYTNTSSIYVGRAVLSDSATTATAAATSYSTIASLTTGTGIFGGTFNGSSTQTFSLNTATLMAIAVTATNLASGTAGQLNYQTGPGATGFVSTGTAGQVLVSAGTSAPVYTNTSSIYVGRAVLSDSATTATAAATAYSTIASLSTGTGIFGGTFNGSTAQTFSLNTATLMTTAVTLANTATAAVGYAANVLGGAAGSLPYQSAANATNMLAIGTSGYILSSNGSAPQWTALSGLSAGNATTASNIAGGLANQIPYQSGPGATIFGAGLTYNGTTLTTGNINVSGNTNATSTTTGALQVVGGAGFGGNVFIGGSAYLTGDLYVDGTSFTVNSNNISTGDKTITLSTASTSAALASSSGIQIGSTSTPYASFLYDGSAYWVSAGSNGGGIKVNSTASVVSTTTGALVVTGGAGIGGGLVVGSVVTATNINAVLGTAGAQGNIYGGAAGSLVYQTNTSTTGFLAGGTTGTTLRYFGAAPIWSSTATFSGGTASTATVSAQSETITGGGLGVVGDSYFQNAVNVGGTMYAGNFASTGTIVAGGVRSTTSATPPAGPTVGDIWYATGTDDIYRYTTDGGYSFWLDINGPAIANATAGVITLATLKATVAASTSFADFQTRIAAL